MIGAIVNTKGGVGKSTTANLIARMICWDHPDLVVGVIDANGHQGTTTNILRQRQRYKGVTPALEVVGHSQLTDLEDAKDADLASLDTSIQSLEQAGADVTLIDTPGWPDDGRSEMAELAASTLSASGPTVVVTPVCLTAESLDQIGVIIKGGPIQAGPCAEVMRRARRENGARWVVFPNQVSAPEDVTPFEREEMRRLEELSEKFDFEIAPGLRQRKAYPAAVRYGFTPIDMKRERLEALVGPFDWEGVVAECRQLAAHIFPNLSGAVDANRLSDRIANLANVGQDAP